MNQRNPPLSDRVEESDEYGLVRLIDIMIEQRRLIILITLAFLAAGALYAFLASPVYQVDIMFQVEDSPESSTSKSPLSDVSTLFDVKSNAAAEAQILGSRLIVTRAVDAVHAYI